MPKIALPASAVVAIISDDDKFLVIKRSANVRSPNLHCFPGGMIEQGETPSEALVREMNEELNIDVTPVREIWNSRTPKGTRLHWWTASSDQLERVFPNPDEVASFQWLTLENMYQLEDVLISNKEFFHCVQTGELSPECLYG